MVIIPLQPIPSQNVTVLLGGQYCQINVYEKFFGLFIDLYVDNALVIGGVLCQNLNRVVLSAYLGFIGDLCFIDNQGGSDPRYAGLGGRFSLAYLEASDLDGAA